MAGQAEVPLPWRMEVMRRDSTVGKGVVVWKVMRVVVKEVVSFWGGIVVVGRGRVDDVGDEFVGIEMQYGSEVK